MKRIISSCLLGIVLASSFLAQPASAQIRIILGDDNRYEGREWQRGRYDRDERREWRRRQYEARERREWLRRRENRDNRREWQRRGEEEQGRRRWRNYRDH